MSIINKIGLEAEFFLRNAKGALVFPGTHGFDTDDFCILGEMRGAPGTTRAEALSNFLTVYWKTMFKARDAGLTVEIKNGWTEVSPKTYASILRKQNVKHVAKAENIYDTDILSLTDVQVDNGKVLGHRVSAGLHIHFSSEAVDTVKTANPKAHVGIEEKDLATLFGDEASRAKLLARLSKELALDQDEYDANEDDGAQGKVTVRASRICEAIIGLMVKDLDTNILPTYVADLPKLKYRHPGFFERKSYGFEYRSLPFSAKVLAELDTIVDHAFEALESLDKPCSKAKTKSKKGGAKGAPEVVIEEKNPELAE